MREAIVLTHVAFEDLGSFKDVLTERGYEVETYDACTLDWSQLEHRDPELLFVLGGPISVHDTELFPFLHNELQLISDRLRRDRPCIGVCLGAQLMAVALGASVKPMATKEIGFGPLRLTQAGTESALVELGVESVVLHWHGEELSLPAGAVRLAESTQCEVQAFSWKQNGLALQFHLEAEPRHLPRWYVGHIVELGAAGVSVPALREQATTHANNLRERAQLVLSHWLEERGL